MKKKKRVDIDDVLEHLAIFINTFKETDEFSGEFSPEIFFSSKEYGALFLDGEDAELYRACLRRLVEGSEQGERISKKTIESLMQDAILKSLDTENKNPEMSFDERVSISLSDLKTALLEKPRVYEVYYPIHGLAADGLPINFGDSLFTVFDDTQKYRFYSLAEDPEYSQEDIEKRRLVVDDLIGQDLIGKPAIVAEVLATDSQAAVNLALKKIQQTIDVINFFTDLLNFPSSFLYLPSEKDPAVVSIPVMNLGDKPSFTVSKQRVGPLGNIPLDKLFLLASERNLGLQRVSFLLCKDRRGLEEQIISSIQWAGRATTERRKEESFLLYAIALESLILSDTPPTELVFRLRTRVAHLLGKNLSARKEISAKVSGLYGIRSKIVHSGTFQVTDADYGLMRTVTKGSILRILNDKTFSSMKKIDELISWFRDQILGSVTDGLS